MFVPLVALGGTLDLNSFFSLVHFQEGCRACGALWADPSRRAFQPSFGGDGTLRILVRGRYLLLTSQKRDDCAPPSFVATSIERLYADVDNTGSLDDQLEVIKNCAAVSFVGASFVHTPIGLTWLSSDEKVVRTRCVLSVTLYWSLPSDIASTDSRAHFDYPSGYGPAS